MYSENDHIADLFAYYDKALIEHSKLLERDTNLNRPVYGFDTILANDHVYLARRKLIELISRNQPSA